MRDGQGMIPMSTEEQRKRNVRLGLILGGIALAFFVGFVVRMVVLGHATPSAFLLASAAAKPPLLATLNQAAAFAKAGMPVDQALATASRHWGLEAFSLLGSANWMLALSALGGAFALYKAAHSRRPRDQAAFAVLATRAGFLFLTIALSVALCQAFKFALGRAHPPRSRLRP